jgi:hypothetical protein
MLILPLAHTGLARIRAMGVLAPVVPPYWLGEKPVVDMSLRSLRHLGDDSGSSAPRFVSGVSGRPRHGFIVYSGGREAPTGDRGG